MATVPYAPTFLSSPLKTLMSSILPHDLLESYHTLSLRLNALVSSSLSTPALHPLRSDASRLVQVLKRDLERALLNPLAFPVPSSSTSSHVQSPPLQTSIVSSSPESPYIPKLPHIINLTLDDVKRVTDSVKVCHAALRLVSVLFRFECLFRVFEVHDLQTLLHSTLSLIPPHTDTDLPTPNSTKTCALVVWILQSQRLPPEVLRGDDHIMERIVRILKGVLVAGGRKTGWEKVTEDVLKTCTNLLLAHPCASLSTTTRHFLPDILSYLVSPSEELRWGAAEVLGVLCSHLVGAGGESKGKGKGKQDGREMDHVDIWHTCAMHVRAFIDAQSSRRTTITTTTTMNSDIRLSHILSISLATPPPIPTHTPFVPSDAGSKLISTSKHQRLSLSRGGWALHTLLTLLILSTPPNPTCSSHSANAYLHPQSIFTHPRSLKLFVTLFGEALAGRRTEVRRGGERGWRVLVWAFGRFCDRGRGDGSDEGENDVEERVFRVVKQELGGGIGILLVGVLLNGCDGDEQEACCDGSPMLGPRSSTRSVFSGTGSGSGPRSASESREGERHVERALVVVGDMIRNERQSTAKDGIELLMRLVSGIGSSTSPSTNAIQPWTVHSALPHVTTLDVGLSNPDGHGGGFGSEDVRQLTEKEVERWCEMLIHVWVGGVERFLREDVRVLEGREAVRNHLVLIWQSLLLVQTQLTQGHAHLTTHNEFANRVAPLVSSFFVPSPSSPPASTDSQYNRLKFVSKLWHVLKNVFGSSLLAGPAEHILGNLIRVRWYYGDVKVRTTWSALSTELAASAGVFLLDLLNGDGDGDTPTEHNAEVGNVLNIDTKRELWGVLANIWNGRDSKGHIYWANAVKLLGIPFGSWAMNDCEMVLWEGILRCAIVAAGTVSFSPAVVIEMVFHRLGERKVDRSARLIEVINILLSHLDILSTTTLPTEIFMMLNEILENLYPPLHPQDIQPSLRLLCTLKAVIIATPLFLLVPLLAIVQNGLCMWIEDKKEIVQEAEYNDVIISLYTDSLTKLRNHLLSTDLLQALTPFFASAFVRIPPPALGPLAFHAFWKATFHGKEEFFGEIPAKLRVCLKAFDDAYGSDLAVGLSHDSESQSFDSSVPDSEPSRAINGLIPALLIRGSQQSAIVDAQAMVFEKAALSSSSISFQYETATDSSILHGLQALTPFSRNPIPAISALSQLREHSSCVGDGSGKPSTPASYLNLSRPRSPILPRGLQIFPSLKRPRDPIKEVSMKRTRTVPKSSLDETNKNLSSSVVGSVSLTQLRQPRLKKADSSLKHTLEDSPPMKRSTFVSFSEPKSRVMSPNPYLQDTSELSFSHRKVKFDGVEVPTYRQILEWRRKLLVTTQGKELSPQISDDFNSWEAALDIYDLRSLQHTDISVPATAIDDSSDGEPWKSSPIMQNTSSLPDDPTLLSPTSIRRSQSQILAQVSSRHPPLRTSVRLEVLHQAYNIVSNDASQMQVQDLVQATRLVHQIGSVLNEHLGRQLDGGSEGR